MRKTMQGEKAYLSPEARGAKKTIARAKKDANIITTHVYKYINKYTITCANNKSIGHREQQIE